ncbi:MAG: hypothetical protein ABSE48_20605 [Verrucomicrobiota bacterium]
MQNLRDKMLHDLEMVLSGSSKAPDLQELQTKLSALTEAQKQTVRELAERLTTAGMHDFLFAISDSGGAVRVLVDGQDVAELSDGLHGEIFGDVGWISRFSKYPSEVEIGRSKWAREEIQKMIGKKDNNVA